MTATADSARLNAVLNALGDGVLVLNKEKVIEMYNDAAVQLFGFLIYDYYHKYGKLDIYNKKLDELVTLLDLNGNRVDPVGEVYKTRLPVVRDDIYFKNPDGGRVIIYGNFSPVFDKNERVDRVIVLMRDVTAEKEFQERMKEFVSVTSHELRTPIAIIEGNLSTALLPKMAPDVKKLKQFIKNAYDTTLFLAKLVDDLTLLRKIEAGGAEQEDLESFHPAEVIVELVEEFEQRAKEKGLKIKTDFPKTSTPKITTSKTKIRQVLLNLIDNAIKYTKTGGVRMKLRFIGRQVTIEVIDTGVGIKPEHQKKIFSRFYRAEQWETRRSRGTGLGLYISKRVIEHLGGTITFLSKVGKGTAFKVTLPKVYPGATHK